MTDQVSQAHLINLVSQFLAWAVRNGNDDLRLVMEYAGQQLVKEVMQAEHATEQFDDPSREEVMPAEVHLAQPQPDVGPAGADTILQLKADLNDARLRLADLVTKNARAKEVNYAAQKRWRENNPDYKRKRRKRKAKNGARKRKSSELVQ